MGIYNHRCTLCALHKGAKTVCMEGRGEFESRAMIIGEAPGRNEDRTGKPFVGDAGRMLNSALAITFEDAAIRERIFITNVVKCRPPQNAKPTLRQRHAC